MMIDALVAESRRARAIAEDYRRQGFTVLENPSPEQLPEFLAGFRLDLVAERASNSSGSGVESVVVVVTARHKIGKEPKIGELAELLRDKPEWKFELALIETEALLEIPEVAVAFGLKEILGYQYEAGKLLNAGFNEAAVLTAWAAAEATVRFLLEEDGQLMEAGEGSPERFTMPRLLSSAVYHGVISRADYFKLIEAKRQRDAFAHGFVLPNIDAAKIASVILSATKGLLQEYRALDAY